jgi:hypothetical protein
LRIISSLDASFKSSGNQLINDYSCTPSANLFEIKVSKIMPSSGTREYLASELVTGGMLEFFMEGTRSRPVNLHYPRNLIKLSQATGGGGFKLKILWSGNFILV